MWNLIKSNSELRWALGVLGVIFAFLVWDQQHWWRLRDEYLFGFLVPVFVFWVINERKGLLRLSLSVSAGRGDLDTERLWHRQLVSARNDPWPAWAEVVCRIMAISAAVVGFMGVVFGALYRAMEGHNLVTTQLLALAGVLLVLSGGFLFFDRRDNGEAIPLKERLMMVGLLLFPALIWTLSAPLFNFLDKTIRTFLMNKVAFVVFEVFDILGLSVVREGSVLVLPTGKVGVEEACSGIYSLMASLFAGSFLAAICLPLGFKALWKKILMVVFAMVFAFGTNIGRSFILTGLAYVYGPKAIEEDFILLGVNLGSPHDFLGYAVIIPVVIALRLLVPLFNFSFEIADPGAAHRARPENVAADQ